MQNELYCKGYCLFYCLFKMIFCISFNIEFEKKIVPFNIKHFEMLLERTSHFCGVF